MVQILGWFSVVGPYLEGRSPAHSSRRDPKIHLRRGSALWEYEVHINSRYVMDHSAPILANFEALPEILTAEELEKFYGLTARRFIVTHSADSYRICGLNRVCASQDTRCSAGWKNAASSPGR
jgi:hypothetical protein